MRVKKRMGELNNLNKVRNILVKGSRKRTRRMVHESNFIENIIFYPNHILTKLKNKKPNKLINLIIFDIVLSHS